MAALCKRPTLVCAADRPGLPRGYLPGTCSRCRANVALAPGQQPWCGLGVVLCQSCALPHQDRPTTPS